jgi:hypothetical protein
MAKLSKLVLRILTNSFIVSVLSLLIGFLCTPGSFIQQVFNGIGLYGTIITVYIFLFHLLVIFISFIVKWVDKQS